MTNYKDKIEEKYKKILFIHGWGFTNQVWVDFVENNIPMCNCICIDLYKYIDNSNGDLTVAAKKIVNEHDDIDLVVSWSLGCFLGKEIERLRNNRSFKMIYVSYNPKFKKTKDWKNGFNENTINQLRIDLKNDIKKAFKNFYLLILGKYRTKKNLYKEIKKNLHPIMQINITSLLNALDILEKKDFLNCKFIGSKNLYIYGENDEISPPIIKEKIRYLGPDASVVIIPNSSHIPFLTNKECFLKIIKEFL